MVPKMTRQARSASQGAQNFGISMSGNVATCVVKEFLPEIGRWLSKKREVVAKGGASPLPK
jgi:hypothetical protein